jgi:MFS family permease
MSAVSSFGKALINNRYLIALEHRDFRTIWYANVSAAAAAWALIVARGWLAYELSGGSSFLTGLTVFAAMVPLFIVPPFIGVLADRVNRRNLVAWTYGFNLLHNLVLAALVLTDAIQVWHLVALALVNGTARAAQMPATQSLVPSLVPRDRLLNALSLNAATMHGSRLVGPLLVTPVLALLGAGAAFLMCSVFYAVGLVQVLRVKTVSRGGVQAGQSALQAFVEGLSYSYRQPVIRSVVILSAFHCALTMAYESILPSQAKALNSPESGFGTLMMAVGAGSLVGSLWIGGVRSMLNKGRMLFVVGFFSGVAMFSLGLAPNMYVAVAVAVAAGVAQAAFMTLTQAITQGLADDRYRGRVASIFTFHVGGLMALINLTNGILADVFSATAIMVVSGTVFTTIAVFTVGLPALRRIYTTGLPSGAVMGHAAPAPVPAGGSK